jgi:hypothetical protein
LKLTSRTIEPPKSASEIAIDVTDYTISNPWPWWCDSLEKVERILVVARNFETPKQLAKTVECIRTLSKEPAIAKGSSSSALSGAVGWVKGILPAKIKYRFGLRTLAIHACDPSPKAVLPEAIVMELKEFVEKGRGKRSGPGPSTSLELELLLRPPPEEQDLQWFRERGVRCILTSDGYNIQCVKPSCDCSHRFADQFRRMRPNPRLIIVDGHQ